MPSSLQGSPEESLFVPRRRNARSLDLSRSDASKAAAWVWHLHTSKTAETSPKLVTESIWESRRRSSCDRKDSRFRVEAAAAAASAAATPTASASTLPQPDVWDCGSKLYDTFELVSFSNRLDRSLISVPTFEAPNRHHALSPLHHRFASVLRTLSLPHGFSLAENHHFASHDVESPLDTVAESTYPAGGSINPSLVSENVEFASQSHAASVSRPATTKWSMSRLFKTVKKMVNFRRHIQCLGCTKKPAPSNDKDEARSGSVSSKRLWYKTNARKIKEDHQHLHHHHHHYHHHFLHHLDESHNEAAVAATTKEPVSVLRRSTTWRRTRRPSARAESARLSTETLSKICTDRNWL